jgi:hypothetical protein
VAGHHLIEEYLDDLRRGLPAATADELADGLLETFEARLAETGDPGAAARGAIAEFGTAGTVHAAFTRQAPGRRLAVRLLTTGLVVGACWAAALVAGRAWTWALPAALLPAAGAALGVTVVALLLAATARRYARTRFAAVGGAVLVVLDTAMIAVALTAAPALVWPMALAIPASAVRAVATVRAVPRIA